MEALVARDFSASKVLPYYRTGRRYYLYQKNTQSANVLFSQQYYEQVHEPTHLLHHQFYEALAASPVQEPSKAPVPPEMPAQDLFPDTDERYLRMEAEKRRVADVSCM